MISPTHTNQCKNCGSTKKEHQRLPGGVMKCKTSLKDSRWDPWTDAEYAATVREAERVHGAMKRPMQIDDLPTVRSAMQRLVNSLCLRPRRICRTLHKCCLCSRDIVVGDEYRGDGLDRRAHQICVEAAAATRDKGGVM